jgi:7,8-dihydropterin-6-yl-methyl-4-(beta-D-ribofuranosyl)aminobenzene 5'-phosphate synthase
MSQSHVSLKQADRVEILTIMDNYTDVLLRNTKVVTRPPLAKGGSIPVDALLAEHGLSLLVKVYHGEEKHTILFDTGYTNIGVPHNLELLNVDLNEIEAIAVSHGHMDHTGSLYAVLDKMSAPVPVVVHPDAFLSPRYFGLDDGRKLLFPLILVKEKFEDRNAEIIESRTPKLLADDMVMVTGQVERVTAFEKGLPNAQMERNGKIEKDLILDDQALVINLKGKGLVVIAGCSHAGIINTILYAGKMTGVEKVHTVLGGFHLSGPIFEPIIEETIKEFKKMAPEVLVPMHCTGWKAIQRFSDEFPSSFVLNSVGSRFTLS